MFEKLKHLLPLSLSTEARMVGEIQKSQGYPGETSNIFSWGGVYDH